MSSTVARTAFAIAAVCADEALLAPSERLFDDPYAALFAAAADAEAAEGTRRFLDLPFFRDGIRLRTRFIDDVLREALSQGISQAVLLGVGFDARALRMPELAARGARIFEVDLAEQIEARRSLLDAAGVVAPPFVAQVACDFDAPDFEVTLTEGLVAQGFRPGVGTIFVWEGVTAYITRASIDRSLAWMARAAGPGGRVVFDFGHFSFDPEGASEVMRRHGYCAFEEHGMDELWRRYLPGEAHENAWVARMGVARAS
jgi:methyltransferase (TIGR00027 family)